jgi:hypothetical protein
MRSTGDPLLPLQPQPPAAHLLELGQRAPVLRNLQKRTAVEQAHKCETGNRIPAARLHDNRSGARDRGWALFEGLPVPKRRAWIPEQRVFSISRNFRHPRPQAPGFDRLLARIFAGCSGARSALPSGRQCRTLTDICQNFPQCLLKTSGLIALALLIIIDYALMSLSSHHPRRERSVLRCIILAGMASLAPSEGAA